MNIKPTGVNNSKVNFFKEVAVAFDFLALFYSLNEEKQNELMGIITKFQAESLTKGK